MTVLHIAVIHYESKIFFNCFGQVIGPFQGACIIQILGTNNWLSRLYGPDPRNSPKIILGNEGVTLNSGVLGVFGEFVAIGRPMSHAWVPLSESVSIGNTSILVDALIDWPNGSEIVISPSDFDPHEAELHTIASTVVMENGQTRVYLRKEIQFYHFAGEWESYGSRRMKMQAKVGLLSRNIVIQGSGQGENSPYTSWNAPKKSSEGKTRACGNRICEIGENSLDCAADCNGPAFEYGASIFVSSYSEEFSDCSQNDRCLGNTRRLFQGTINISNVELRYYGQNGQNSIQGVVLSNLGSGVESNVLQNITFNRGYSGAVYLRESSGVVVRDSVFYRSLLPGIKVSGGSNNSFVGVLGVVAIFWNTHRGMTQVGLIINVNCCLHIFVLTSCTVLSRPSILSRGTAYPIPSWMP